MQRTRSSRVLRRASSLIVLIAILAIAAISEAAFTAPVDLSDIGA